MKSTNVSAMASTDASTDLPKPELELPEVRIRARNRAAKRWFARLVVVTTAWYTGVYIFLPTRGCGPTRFLVDMARRALIAHAKEICATGQDFADFRKSQALTRLQAARKPGNRYLVTVLLAREESGSILVLYPERHETYCQNVLYRVLFWDWRTVSFPTFALTSGGDLFGNYSARFDLRNPPTDAVLQELGKTHGWSFERRLSLTPPCE